MYGGDRNNGSTGAGAASASPTSRLDMVMAARERSAAKTAKMKAALDRHFKVAMADIDAQEAERTADEKVRLNELTTMARAEDARAAEEGAAQSQIRSTAKPIAANLDMGPIDGNAASGGGGFGIDVGASGGDQRIQEGKAKKAPASVDASVSMGPSEQGRGYQTKTTTIKTPTQARFGTDGVALKLGRTRTSVEEIYQPELIENDAMIAGEAQEQQRLGLSEGAESVFNQIDSLYQEGPAREDFRQAVDDYTMNAELVRNKTIPAYVASLVKQGVPAGPSQEMGEAYRTGNWDKLYALMDKHPGLIEANAQADYDKKQYTLERQREEDKAIDTAVKNRQIESSHAMAEYAKGNRGSRFFGNEKSTYGLSIARKIAYDASGRVVQGGGANLTPSDLVAGTGYQDIDQAQRSLMEDTHAKAISSTTSPDGKKVGQITNQTAYNHLVEQKAEFNDTFLFYRAAENRGGGLMQGIADVVGSLQASKAPAIPKGLKPGESEIPISEVMSWMAELYEMAPNPVPLAGESPKSGVTRRAKAASNLESTGAFVRLKSLEDAQEKLALSGMSPQQIEAAFSSTGTLLVPVHHIDPEDHNAHVSRAIVEGGRMQGTSMETMGASILKSLEQERKAIAANGEKGEGSKGFLPQSGDEAGRSLVRMVRANSEMFASNVGAPSEALIDLAHSVAGGGAGMMDAILDEIGMDKDSSPRQVVAGFQELLALDAEAIASDIEQAVKSRDEPKERRPSPEERRRNSYLGQSAASKFERMVSDAQAATSARQAKRRKALNKPERRDLGRANQ